MSGSKIGYGIMSAGMRTGDFGVRPVTVDGRPVQCRTLPGADGRAATPPTLPIVLLHGLGCSWEAWKPAMRCLAVQKMGAPAFVPDLPGFGHSPGPPKALDVDALADWTVRLMDELGVGRAHLAGHSMGCQIALALARRHPERAGGIVLVGPTTGAGRVPYWRYVVGLFCDGFREPLRYNLTLLKMYAQMGLRRYLATVRKMMKDEPLDHAAEVHSPVLVLRGEHDAIVPLDVARQLGEALPQGRFVLVMDAAHALQYHSCQDFVALAVPFWQEVEGRLGAQAEQTAEEGAVV